MSINPFTALSFSIRANNLIVTLIIVFRECFGVFQGLPGLFLVLQTPTAEGQISAFFMADFEKL